MKKFIIILTITQLAAFASYGAVSSSAKATVEKTAIARPSDATGKEVIRIIENKLYVDDDEVKYGAKLMDDFGADELDVIELIMEIEKVFNIVITDPELEIIEKGTVNDLLKLVRLKVSAKRPANRQN